MLCMLLSAIAGTEQLVRPSNNAMTSFWHNLLANLPLGCLIGSQKLYVLKAFLVSSTAVKSFTAAFATMRFQLGQNSTSHTQTPRSVQCLMCMTESHAYTCV